MEDLTGKFFKSEVANWLTLYIMVIGHKQTHLDICQLSIGVGRYTVSVEIMAVGSLCNYTEITSDQFYAQYANLMFHMNNIISPDND